MRLAVDWDGTCVEHVYPDMGDWLPGAVEALQELVRQGWELVIFSCRVADVALDEVTPVDGAIEVAKIKDMLDAVGLGHIEVWTRPHKPAAMAYIDDRAIRFQTWDQVLEEIPA